MQSYDDIAREYDELKAAGKEFDGLVPVKARIKQPVDIVYSVRFTAEDIKAIDRKAKARGLRPSAFIREAALREALREDDAGSEQKALKRELAAAKEALDRASALA